MRSVNTWWSSRVCPKDCPLEPFGAIAPIGVYGVREVGTETN